nr:carboxypeptidase-like regulatory domain-containing protein [Ignavibacteriaceae bacterium]
MKILIVLFFIINISAFAQQITIQGKVLDAENNLPLVNTNIFVSNRTGIGTYSDQNGEFELTSVFKTDTLNISFVGYETGIVSISELFNIPAVQTSGGNVVYTFHLNKKAIPSQTILIEATIGKVGLTPLAFDQLTAAEIEKTYSLYDIPKYLSDLPSTTFYSEGGSGIGYNYLSIRGFDQRRITVS